MFEIHVRSDSGWLPVSCSCPAGRAVFASEQAAASAIDRHLSDCVRGAERDKSAEDFRSFAVEAVPS